MLEKYVIMCPQALRAMQFTISEVEMLAHSDRGGKSGTGKIAWEDN